MISALFCLTIPLYLLAGDPTDIPNNQIKVKIVGESNQPLPFATVRINDGEMITTDEHGEITIPLSDKRLLLQVAPPRNSAAMYQEKSIELPDSVVEIQLKLRIAFNIDPIPQDLSEHNSMLCCCYYQQTFLGFILRRPPMSYCYCCSCGKMPKIPNDNMVHKENITNSNRISKLLSRNRRS